MAIRKLIFALSSFFAGLSTSIADGGFIIGNGGDMVFCEQSSVSPYSGYYSLDYLIENQSTATPVDDSLNKITQNVIQSLITVDPYLAKSYADFFDSFQSSTSSNREWVPMAPHWNKLEDESLMKLVPGNCRAKNVDSGNTPLLRQAVIRWSNDPRSDKLKYEFDLELIDSLRLDKPLQLSYLLVHEWLWDTTDNVRLVRKLNSMIHRGLLNSMSPKDFEIFFSSLGGYSKDLPNCSRSSVLLSALSADVKKASCLKEEAFAQTTILDFSELESQLFIGDFSGFSEVREISFRETDRLLEMIPSHSLDPFLKLEVLSLMNSKLETFPWTLWSYDFPGSLEVIDLRGHRFSEEYSSELKEVFEKKHPTIELILF